MTESTLVTDPGNGTLEVFPLPIDTGCLHSLLKDVFQNYWDQIYFGTAVEGRCGITYAKPTSDWRLTPGTAKPAETCAGRLRGGAARR